MRPLGCLTDRPAIMVPGIFTPAAPAYIRPGAKWRRGVVLIHMHRRAPSVFETAPAIPSGCLSNVYTFINSGGQRRTRPAALARPLRFQRRPAARLVRSPKWRITEVLTFSATRALICFQGSAGAPVRFAIRATDPGRRLSQQPPAAQPEIRWRATHLRMHSFRYYFCPETGNHSSQMKPCHCSSSESQYRKSAQVSCMKFGGK